MGCGGGLFLSFDEAFDLLRRHPLIGALQEDVRPPIHSLPHRSHRILCDVIDGEIIVQRVLHMAMDVRKHLGQ